MSPAILQAPGAVGALQGAPACCRNYFERYERLPAHTLLPVFSLQVPGAAGALQGAPARGGGEGDRRGAGEAAGGLQERKL